MTLPYNDVSRAYECEPARTQSLVTRIRTIIFGEASHSNPSSISSPDNGRTIKTRIARRAISSAPLLFIFCWIYTLWWGERSIFQRQVEDCAWGRWETWVSNTPHGYLLSNRKRLISRSRQERFPTTLFSSPILSW